MSKYIDLIGQITERLDVPCGNIRLGIHEALAYLDRNPDQAPGRTITESESKDLFSTARRGLGYWPDALERTGITVAPDPEPEPTEAEKLAKIISEYTYNSEPQALAEALVRAGVRASGGGE